MSDHKAHYYRLTHKIQKTSFVDILENINLYLKEDDHPEDFEITDEYLTKEEFDKLAEFEGF
jgi:hypothetical protein